ncbi:hypothetical protein O1L55_15155, partial [Streptomyces albulus]|nr:hypothetical protein [Streptomyces noursei]
LYFVQFRWVFNLDSFVVVCVFAFIVKRFRVFVRRFQRTEDHRGPRALSARASLPRSLALPLPHRANGAAEVMAPADGPEPPPDCSDAERDTDADVASGEKAVRKVFMALDGRHLARISLNGLTTRGKVASCG